MRQELAKPKGSAPASRRSPKLPHSADQGEIDGITWKPVRGNSETWDTAALENFQAHANRARKNNIGGKTVSHAQGQNPREAAVDPSEDKYDKPDAEQAEAQNRHALQYASYKSPLQTISHAVFSNASRVGSCRVRS